MGGREEEVGWFGRRRALVGRSTFFLEAGTF